MTTRENDTKELLKEIAELYDYDLTISKDGKVIFDGGSWKHEFDSMNQAMKYWLPDFETADSDVFTEEIKFINKCMMEDYLELFDGGAYIQENTNHFLILDGEHDIHLYIEYGRICCSGMDCIENAKSAFDNDPEMLKNIAIFENDWYYYNKQKNAPSSTKAENICIHEKEMTDGQDDKKHNYLITMAAEESADMEIELTDKEYEIVERVFHEIDSKCHGLCGSVYIESLERDDMDEMDMEDREA